MEEVRMGEKIHQSILEQSTLYSNPQVVDYVDQVGQRIAKQTPRAYLPYRFTVLEDNRIYSAFAPGGFVYITTGMLQFLENEMELAAVLSHEIARIQYHFFGVHQLQQAASALGSVSAMAGFVFPPAALIAPLGMAAADSYFTKEKSVEEQTYEADLQSLDYLVKSGFDPQGSIDVMYKFAQIKGDDVNRIINYYHTHPITPERIDRLYKHFKQINLTHVQFDTHWAQYRQATAPLRTTSS